MNDTNSSQRVAELRRRLRKLTDLQTAVANEIQAVRMEIAIQPRPTSKGPRVRKPRNVRPPCGTDSGYQWHRYHEPDNWPLPDNDPCGCKRAHRDRVRFKAAEKRSAA